MMATKADMVRSSVFKLGRVCFAVDNYSQEFIRDLEVLLPHAGQAAEVREIEMGSEQDMRGLINTIFEYHLGCVWMDAGCLVAPNGKRILICGQSGTGKSTTTMALALGYSWKVAAEDVLLIDSDKDEVIPFASPFSLKAGTSEMLADCIGRRPEPVLQGEWSPMYEMAVAEPFQSHFDISIVLAPRSPDAPQLQIKEISAAEYLRGILKLSNVLRCPGASDKVVTYLEHGRCLQLSGGTLKERLQKIFELCA